MIYISSRSKQNSMVENPTNNKSCDGGFFQTEDISVPQLGEEHGILQLLGSIDFWLNYFVYFCGGTMGLVYMNNQGIFFPIPWIFQDANLSISCFGVTYPILSLL